MEEVGFHFNFLSKLELPFILPTENVGFLFEKEDR